MYDGKALKTKFNMRDNVLTARSCGDRYASMTIRCSALIVPRQSVFELSRRRCRVASTVCLYAEYMPSLCNIRCICTEIVPSVENPATR